MTQTLLASLIGLFVPVIVNAVLKWAQAFTAGANASTAAANKESQDAQARMSKADAMPRSRSSAADRLRGGTA